MKDLKTRKFWFLVISVSICISFSGFTVLNQFTASSKIYAESFSEKGAESDEKSSEHGNPFYIHESSLELRATMNGCIAKNLRDLNFILPAFWPSPQTPPPDLG